MQHIEIVGGIFKLWEGNLPQKAYNKHYTTREQPQKVATVPHLTTNSTFILPNILCLSLSVCLPACLFFRLLSADIAISRYYQTFLRFVNTSFFRNDGQTNGVYQLDWTIH